MRKAYRRTADPWQRLRKVATSFFLAGFTQLGLVVFFHAAAKSVETHPGDWSRAVGFGTFAALLGIAGLAAMLRTARVSWSLVVGFRDDRTQGDAISLPVRFAGRWHVMVMTATFSVALLLGGLAMVSAGTMQLLQYGANEDSAVVALLLGLIVLFYFYYVLAWFPLFRRSRDMFVIGREGVQASWIEPTVIPWAEIVEIRTIPDANRPTDPDADIVLLDLCRPSPHSASQVCVIDMAAQFGRSPEELLSALDVARPSTVTIVDPRRLDGDGAGEPQGRNLTAPSEPLVESRPAYRRKLASCWLAVPQALGFVLILAMVAGAYWVAVWMWFSWPENFHLYAPEYRDREIAIRLTVTGVLIVPITALIAVVIGSFIPSRARSASAPGLWLLTSTLGLLAIGLGTATALLYHAFGFGLVNVAIGGAITAWAAKAWRRSCRARSAPMLTVDHAGLHVASPVAFFLPWRAIGAIGVSTGTRAGGGRENNVITFYARQMARSEPILLRFRVRPIACRRAFQRATPELLKIDPRRDLGLSPTAVLDALNRFRPADVPIHDPWQV